MIHLKTIVNHCTRKGYIPLRNGRKKKLQKQSILICVKFFLALYMTYLFYCINRFRLECPLRKGMVMGVSMCKMLHLFSLKVVAFTLNYIKKVVSVVLPRHKGAVFHLRAGYYAFRQVSRNKCVCFMNLRSIVSF